MTSASGGNSTDSAGGDERRPLAVERQHGGGLGVEPAAHAGEQRPDHEQRQRGADDGDEDAGDHRVAAVVKRAAALERGDGERDHGRAR